MFKDEVYKIMSAQAREAAKRYENARRSNGKENKTGSQRALENARRVYGPRSDESSKSTMTIEASDIKAIRQAIADQRTKHSKPVHMTGRLTWNGLQRHKSQVTRASLTLQGDELIDKFNPFGRKLDMMRKKYNTSQAQFMGPRYPPYPTTLPPNYKPFPPETLMPEFSDKIDSLTNLATMDFESILKDYPSKSEKADKKKQQNVSISSARVARYATAANKLTSEYRRLPTRIEALVRELPVPPRGPGGLKSREPTGYELMKAVEGVINNSNPWNVTVRLEYSIDNSKMKDPEHNEWVVPMLPRKSVIMHCEHEDHIAAKFFPIRHVLPGTFNSESSEEWKQVASFFLHLLSKERLRTYLRREERKRIQSIPGPEISTAKLQENALSHLQAVAAKISDPHSDKNESGRDPESLALRNGRLVRVMERTNLLQPSTSKSSSVLGKVSSVDQKMKKWKEYSATSCTSKKSCIAPTPPRSNRGSYGFGFTRRSQRRVVFSEHVDVLGEAKGSKKKVSFKIESSSTKPAEASTATMTQSTVDAPSATKSSSSKKDSSIFKDLVQMKEKTAPNKPKVQGIQDQSRIFDAIRRKPSQPADVAQPQQTTQVDLIPAQTSGSRVHRSQTTQAGSTNVKETAPSGSSRSKKTQSASHRTQATQSGTTRTQASQSGSHRTKASQSNTDDFVPVFQRLQTHIPLTIPSAARKRVPTPTTPLHNRFPTGSLRARVLSEKEAEQARIRRSKNFVEVVLNEKNNRVYL